MARLTLDQINQLTPDMAAYLQSLGYSIGGETDDGMARYMDSEGNWVAPDVARDLTSNEALQGYAADQRRMQGIIDINDYTRAGMPELFAEEGYATPEAYLSQLYGGGERVGDYYVLPEAGDVRGAEMVGTPIVYNSPGLFGDFLLGGLGLLAGGYGLNALTAGAGAAGAGAGVGAAEAAAPAFTGGASGGTIAGAASGGGALSGLTAAEMAALGGGGALAGEFAGGASGGGLAGAGEFAGGASGAGVTGAAGGGALSGAGGGLVASGAGTAIGRIFDGTATAADWAQVLGGAGSALLGVAGSNAQADAYSDVADKYLALGAPYRDLLTASYQPGFSMADQPDFQNALDVGAQAAARATSARVGNPVDNPGAYAEMQKYITGSLALPQLNTYRSQLGSFGQLGTNTAGTGDINAAGQTSGAYNALGYGLGQITQPQGILGNTGALNRLLLNSGQFL